MSDNQEQSVPEKVALSDTKLYQLARAERLVAHLDPRIDMKMALEEELTETYPRSEDDGDDTRILILFANRRGNTAVNMLTDHERLNSTFDLSKFQAGFMATQEGAPGSELDTINLGIATTLNVALGTVLGVDDDRGFSKKQQELCKEVIRSIVSVVLDDPLDAAIVVTEQAMPEVRGEPTRYICIITAMWTLKVRK